VAFALWLHGSRRCLAQYCAKRFMAQGRKRGRKASKNRRTEKQQERFKPFGGDGVPDVGCKAVYMAKELGNPKKNKRLARGGRNPPPTARQARQSCLETSKAKETRGKELKPQKEEG